MTTDDAGEVRGTPEWQSAHFSPMQGVNVRAQVAIGLGIDVVIDTSGLERNGGQLDLFDQR